MTEPGWFVQEDGRLRFWDGRVWTEHHFHPLRLKPGRYRHSTGGFMVWDGQRWEPVTGSPSARPMPRPYRPGTPRPEGSRATRRLVALGVLVVALVGGGLVMALPASADTVQRVVDGDTLVATIDGREERVRLLNIDTPETKDPATSVECLGPEAAEFTESMLPAGTQIELTYDQERRDRYGRLLAHVQLEDGRSVAEELAREGLGVPVSYGDNKAGLLRIQAAFDEARQTQDGFFDPSEACTVPGQYEEATSALQPAAAASPTTSRAATTQAAASLAAIQAARELGRTLKTPGQSIAWAAMSARDLRALRVGLTRGIKKERARSDRLGKKASVLRDAEETARQAREARAREREAARQAADQERADRAAADAARRAPTPDTPPSDSGDSGSSGGSSASNPYPGYTGPRCYAPGGKTWRPCP